MSPLDEHELRTEMNAIDPIRDEGLAARVIARGRAGRTRRRLATAVAAATALAVVVLAAGQLGPLPRQGVPAGPAAPTSGPPSASVGPDLAGFVSIPGALAVVPITLPHEGGADWTTADWYLDCAGLGGPSPLDRLTASKIIGHTEPSMSLREGALVFASPAAAADFVDLMSAGARQQCDGASADDETRRRVSIVDPSPQSAEGFEEGRTVGAWIETDLNGRWTALPGGTSIALLRTGNTVVFAAERSESFREPTTFPAYGVAPEVVRSLEGLFPQACGVAGTC